MSQSPKTRVAMLAAGMCCFLLSSAWAQLGTELETERQSRPAQNDDAQDADQIRPGQQHTAQFRGTQAAGSQNEAVERFLATCLLEKNKAEVELAKFAQQQAQNPEVKKFAQRMAQDHQQIVQKLQPLAKQDGAQTSATGQLDTQRQASDTTRLPGSPGAGQPSRDTNRGLTSAATDGQQNAPIMQLAQIERQIIERHKEAVREELQQKQGAEFDKSYVASQIAGHVHMLAALEVIEQQGPDQLRQIAQQARPNVQEHLDHAKQLKKQLEGSGSSRSQAERQPQRTQR